jgi:hypothetical protein
MDTPILRKSTEAEGTKFPLKAGEGVVNETQPGEACAWPGRVVVRDFFS